MLNIALKEWKIICDLLLDGELAFLLRKGGIIEEAGPGRFELLHQRFALWPSWAHQKPEMIKSTFRNRVVTMDEPDEIMIEEVGEAVKIWEVPGRDSFDRLDDLHPWTKSQIDMRFNYRPENPLYLVAIRAYRLDKPATIVNDIVAYGGCRSWIEFTANDAINDSKITSCMTDDQFNEIVGRIDEAM